MPADKRDEFMITMRISAIDRKVFDEAAESLSMSLTDFFKSSAYAFVVSQKDSVMKDSLKELARLKIMDFDMKVMKEIEHITHKEAFPLENFMHTMESYKAKFVPIRIVKRYVTARMMLLYKHYSTKERVEFRSYITKFFIHYFPNERIWLEQQFRYIRSMKKNEKDELLVKHKGDLPEIIKEIPAIDFARHFSKDGQVDDNIMKRLPAQEQKDIKKYLSKEKAKAEARSQFYGNKDKYFKNKKEVKQ